MSATAAVSVFASVPASAPFSAWEHAVADSASARLATSREVDLIVDFLYSDDPKSPSIPKLPTKTHVVSFCAAEEHDDLRLGDNVSRGPQRDVPVTRIRLEIQAAAPRGLRGNEIQRDLG